MRDVTEQLQRIQHAIVKIEEYMCKGRKRFDEEEELQLSIIYYLQTISEAARNIPASFQKRYHAIPWKKLIDFQTLITHYYLEIDREALWKIVSHDLPALKNDIDLLLAETRRQGERNNSPSYSDTEKIRIPTDIEALLKARRDDILRVAKRHGAYNIRIFGSVARREADSESDIDLLVDVEPGRTLFDLSELLNDLQELLGHNVDIVTEKSLHSRIRERVLKEAMPL